MQQQLSQKLVFFLNMDMDSARILCAEMIARFGLVWEDRGACAQIWGKHAELERFERWACGFFGTNVGFGHTLEAIALARLENLGLKLATAESCTGGLLSYRFTRINGASSVFVGGVVSYANDIKREMLGVKPDVLEDFGAVSEPVVAQMLSGTLERFGADVALASSGVAGPSGGSEQKPVGCVFLGVQARGKLPLIERHFFHDKVKTTKEAKTEAGLLKQQELLDSSMVSGDGTLSYRLSTREYIQLQASTKAIEILIKYLESGSNP